MGKSYASNEEVAKSVFKDGDIWVIWDRSGRIEGRRLELCFKGDHVILYNKEEAEALAKQWGTEAKCVPPRFANSSWDHFCIVRLPD